MKRGHDSEQDEECTGKKNSIALAARYLIAVKSIFAFRREWSFSLGWSRINSLSRRGRYAEARPRNRTTTIRALEISPRKNSRLYACTSAVHSMIGSPVRSCLCKQPSRKIFAQDNSGSSLSGWLVLLSQGRRLSRCARRNVEGTHR